MAYELLAHPLTPGPLSERDPRGKLLCLLFFTPVVFLHAPLLLGMDLLLLLAALILSGLSPSLYLKESRGFLIMLAFFFLLGILTDPGAASALPSLIDTGRIPESALFVSRLFLVYTAGVVFIRITPVSQIGKGITWFLTPLPGAAAHRIGAAIGLTFTMFPLLMEETARIREAQRCRGADAIRNPVKRILSPLFPLFVNALLRSGRLADALETRAWSSERPFGGLGDRHRRHHLHRCWNRRDTLLFLPLFCYFLVSTTLPMFLH